MNFVFHCIVVEAAIIPTPYFSISTELVRSWFGKALTIGESIKF